MTLYAGQPNILYAYALGFTTVGHIAVCEGLLAGCCHGSYPKPSAERWAVDQGPQPGSHQGPMTYL